MNIIHMRGARIHLGHAIHSFHHPPFPFVLGTVVIQCSTQVEIFLTCSNNPSAYVRASHMKECADCTEVMVKCISVNQLS